MSISYQFGDVDAHGATIRAQAGRGMSTMGSKVAAKVMPRSPAGG